MTTNVKKLSTDLLEGNNFSRRDIEAYCEREGNKPIKLEQERFKITCADILQAYFGVNYDNISEALILAILDHITNYYPALTCFDVISAFRRKEVRKIKGVGMTVSEFCEPIKEWHNEIVKIELKEIEIKQKEEREREEKLQSLKDYQDAKKEALELFNKLKEKGATEWTGDKFQAVLISSKVSDGLISDEEKQEIYEKVVQKIKDERLLNSKNKTDIENFYNKIKQDWNLATYEIRCICAVEVLNRVLLLD